MSFDSWWDIKGRQKDRLSQQAPMREHQYKLGARAGWEEAAQEVLARERELIDLLTEARDALRHAQDAFCDGDGFHVVHGTIYHALDQIDRFMGSESSQPIEKIEIGPDHLVWKYFDDDDWNGRTAMNFISGCIGRTVTLNPPNGIDGDLALRILAAFVRIGCDPICSTNFSKSDEVTKPSKAEPGKDQP